MVLGGLALVAFVFMSTSASRQALDKFRSHHPFAILQLYAGPALAVLCGAVMLRGMNWGRWLFVVWSGYNVVSRLVLGSLILLPQNLLSALLYGTAAYYLFRPAATAFFRGAASVVAESPSEGRATCAECGGAFEVQDMVRHGSLYVCAQCKPRFLQKLGEGVGYTPDSKV
jgi:hypothetical protein